MGKWQEDDIELKNAVQARARINVLLRWFRVERNPVSQQMAGRMMHG
jgi:hypothetical protein